MSKQNFKKILVTGFEPFDQDSVNVSQELIKFLSSQKFEFNLDTLCLPVAFSSASEVLFKEVEKFKPDFVLMTGLAKNRQKISLEKLAINWIDARIPDNNGLLPDIKKIDENKADGLFTQIDLNKIILKLNDPSFEISFSAGAYVCNYVYFKILSEKQIPALFVHLPMPENELSQINIFTSITNLIQLL